MKRLVNSTVLGIVLFLAGIGLLSALSAFTIEIIAGIAVVAIAIFCFRHFSPQEKPKQKYAKAAKQSQKRYAKRAKKLGITLHSSRSAGLAKIEKVSNANLFVIDGKKR